VHDSVGGTTYCPQCNAALIVRDWHRIEAYRVTETGNCPGCGTAIAGRYERYTKQFGRRRMPLSLHRAA
jgi:pyruvate formate lyase activating enzyme